MLTKPTYASRSTRATTINTINPNATVEPIPCAFDTCDGVAAGAAVVEAHGFVAIASFAITMPFGMRWCVALRHTSLLKQGKATQEAQGFGVMASLFIRKPLGILCWVSLTHSIPLLPWWL